jgi:hypothetical protein
MGWFRMKKCLLILMIISLLIAALPVLAQDDMLDKTYVSPDNLFSFNYPGTWKFVVEMDGTATVWDKDTTMYVYGPAQIAARAWGMDDPVSMVERIMARWGKAGDDVSAVQTVTVGSHLAALGYYVHDGYPGLLMIIDFGDGSLGGIEAVGNRNEGVILGEKTALALAESLNVVPGVSVEMSPGDLNNAWLDAINDLAPGSN